MEEKVLAHVAEAIIDHVGEKYLPHFDEEKKAYFGLKRLDYLLHSLGDKDKDRFVTFSMWMSRLKDFDEMETDAVRNIKVGEELNEELQRIRNEKTDFLNEIGLKESDLRIFLEIGSADAQDILDKTNLEEVIRVFEKSGEEIFLNNPDFMEYLINAIDKHPVPPPPAFMSYLNTFDKYTVPAAAC